MNTVSMLAQYFEQIDTPSANSPVGNLMVRILEKYPDLTFEAARIEANQLLQKAAGRRKYRTPKVFSAEELTHGRERLRLLKDKRQKPVRQAA
jgi:hypothetical protein